MINENFIFVGAVLSLVGSLNYVINTLKGRTKPNRVTWFLWALAPLIAFSAEIQKGRWPTGSYDFYGGFWAFDGFYCLFREQTVILENNKVRYGMWSFIYPGFASLGCSERR